MIADSPSSLSGEATTSASSLDEDNEEVDLQLVDVESSVREQALMNLFQHRAIKKADIKKLGLQLGVGLDQTQEIIDESSGDTTIATVRTCCKWIESHADNLTEAAAIDQLYQALHNIGHGRLARKLIYRSRASTLAGKQLLPYQL